MAEPGRNDVARTGERCAGAHRSPTWYQSREPRPRRRSANLGGAASALIAVLALCTAAVAQDVGLERIASGFDRPVGITTDGADPERIYVIEQPGTVRMVRDGAIEDTPFLDVRDRVSTGMERGLIGMVFHPDFPRPAEVFVHYTDTNGDSMLQRMPVENGRARPDRATTMLHVPQPDAIHNGGQLAFGPDGHLYVGLGDGGAGGDPNGNGQNLQTLHGAILRLDVGTSPYGVPEDNPFVGNDRAREEIWAYGLRNPWRFSFAPDGALWIADVGQAAVEEVNREPPDAAGGRNYGWSRLEGDTCFHWRGCSMEGTVLPVISYEHGRGWGSAVTGGYVYQGEAIPELIGSYVFGDFVGGKILVASTAGLMASGSGMGWDAKVLVEAGFPVASFGLDPEGELLIADYSGSVWRLVASEARASAAEEDPGLRAQ